MECQILLNTGASKSFMSNHIIVITNHFFHYTNVSKTQRIQVGNGQFVSVLFIIPIIIDGHGHRF